MVQEETTVDRDLCWAKLLSGSESGFLMGCSCGNTSIMEDEFRAVGLVPRHAYSMLDVKLVNGHRSVCTEFG